MSINHEACVKACELCWRRCIECFTAMASMASDNDCPRSCHQCEIVCETCVELMIVGSPFAEQACALCAEVCEWCAEQCAAHAHEPCQACAAACRECAQACRAVVGAAA